LSRREPVTIMQGPPAAISVRGIVPVAGIHGDGYFGRRP